MNSQRVEAHGAEGQLNLVGRGWIAGCRRGWQHAHLLFACMLSFALAACGGGGDSSSSVSSSLSSSSSAGSSGISSTSASSSSSSNSTSSASSSTSSASSSSASSSTSSVVCDSGFASDSSDPLQFANALELCQTTTVAGTSPGVISAELTLSDGTSTPATVSHAIRESFGVENTPRAGAAMIVLSTGAAAAIDQTYPSYVAFQPGLDTLTSSPAPTDWLTANGNTFPVAPGCPRANSTIAFNPIMLTLDIRVPSNAHSFRISTRFFSSDFPEYVCSPYNDLFVALLDSSYSGTNPNPADKNLARYVTPSSAIYPLGVNLAYGNTGLFSQCVNGNTGCGSGAIPGTISTCTGTTALSGTGMDMIDSTSCAATGTTTIGGGTEWMMIRGNVVPGETIKLRFALWDTGDGLSDSVVLLDNFVWSPDTVTPGASLH